MDHKAPDNQSPLPASGGTSAAHPPQSLFPILVSPTTSGKEKNVIRQELIPIACWRMNDARFDLGLSFVRPESQRELLSLANLVKHHPGAPLSVFGHADPVGTDEENKTLSGRRALAIYGLLIRRTACWERLFDNPVGSDRWGLHALQTILNALGFPPGPIDGVDGPKTQSAFKSFQSAHGIPASGRHDKPTRQALFAEYMRFLIGPLSLQPSDFLAGGADPEGKGDYQGCGEFNAIVRASETQLVRFSQHQHRLERDDFNAPNRRVLILFFRPGTRIPPNKWPCPRALDSPANCRRRFWSDHHRRRQPGLEPREFDKTQDTLACRFYHRLVKESPCEFPTRPRRLRIYLHDEKGNLLANEPYTLTVDGVVIASGEKTSAAGLLDHEVPPSACQGILEIAQHSWSLELHDPPPHSDEAGVRTRLANLGYTHHPDAPDPSSFEFAVASLQKHAEIEKSGQVCSATRRHLDEFHRHG